ncbi:substrate-binding domain-containing protein [Halalkalibacter alkalisediminis]|uniref:Substrate-binding domain-containing protein n=1 Tax=Halalkalibacter alkalisediminis TaxID=935616 RepID=A0ABV6NHU2_9BACI|nr:substrate-binding domain-containing protein [Halalkalibacter alkalisediminis]
MKKKSIISFIGILLFAILIGFLSKSFAEEKPKVVFVLKDLNSQYWEIVKAGAEKGFRDFALDGRVVAPIIGTAEEQSELLQGILKENPDVLVVSPTYAPIIMPILDEFVEQHIPVLLLDTDNSWEHKIAYIGTDNFDLGRKAGSLLASQLQPGDDVAVIGGDVKSPVSGERIEGARLSLNAVQINIATEKVNLANEATPIKDATKEILEEHPNIKGIIATNDVIALQVVKVLEEHGLSIPVTGADGIIEMIELIEDEKIPGTVAQNPFDMGYLSAETALKVSRSERVESTIDSGVDIIIKGNAKQRLNFYKSLLN